MHTSLCDNHTCHLPKGLGPFKEVGGIIPVINTCCNKDMAFDAMITRKTWWLSVSFLPW